MPRRSRPGDVLPPVAVPLLPGDAAPGDWPASEKGYRIRVEASALRAPCVATEASPKRASDQSLDVAQDAINARKRHAAMRVLLRRIGRLVA